MVIFPVWYLLLLQVCFSVSEDQSNEWPIWPQDFRWFSRAPDWDESHCLKIEEPGEDPKHTWGDNWFCSRNTKRRIHWRWNFHSKINGMRCTLINEPGKEKNWNDNYLCVPKESPYHFTWSYRGVIADKSCIAWRELSEVPIWNDNYLCAKPSKDDLPNAIFPRDFKWTYLNTVEGYDCIKIHEPEDDAEDNWHDNYLCWKNTRRNPRMKWSISGSIAGMRCVKINEPSDSKWMRNYLCVPKESDLRFVWNYHTPDDVSNCIKVDEQSEEGYWKDNYLCTQRCQLIKVEVLNAQDVIPTNMGTKVIGIVTGGTCQGGLEQKITLSHAKTKENSVSIEMESSNEVNYALSVSVEVEASGKFLGSGVALKAGVQHTGGYSHTWSNNNVTGSSTSETSESGKETMYQPPGAALIVGLTDEMRLDKSDVNVLQYFKCPGDTYYQKNSVMKLKETSYQATHYQSLVGKFDEEACKNDKYLPNCVKDLKKSGGFIEDFDEIREAFNACFKGKGEV